MEQRVFLVGCPRSGTTLLQSMMAAHPHIASFPESHFFTEHGMGRSRMRRLLGLVSKRKNPQFCEFLRQTGTLARWGRPDISSRFLRVRTRRFIALLDAIALEQGRPTWIEKTPDHLFCIEIINRYCPGAPKYIHLFRGGRETIASLYDVSRKYPAEWDGPWSVKRCVDRWRAAVVRSMLYYGRENHIHVRFEDVVSNPVQELTRISEFLNLEYLPDMLYRRSEQAESLLLNHERWKVGVLGDVTAATGKFDTIFSEAEQLAIEAQVEEVEMRWRQIRGVSTTFTKAGDERASSESQ